MQRMTRVLIGAVVAMIAVAASVGSAGAKPTASAASASTAIASFPVSFQVVNEDRSDVPCQADGGHYTIVGHITGPAAALQQTSIPAAALYVHGDGADESLWTFSAVPGYNYAANVAHDGFVSVTIDRLGYGGSSHPPDGSKICWGSEADMTHQIIQQLKTGSYSAMSSTGAARTPPTIAKIALAGHSAAGYIVMDEAYSFHDISALAVVASGEFFTGHIVSVLGNVTTRCIAQPNGYVYLDPTDADAEADFFYDADPAVESYAVAHRPPDACGGTNNAEASLTEDLLKDGTVTVPVLSIAGADDAFYPHPQQQAKLFSHSSDSTAVLVPDTGHAITLGRSAPVFTADMEKWLAANGFQLTGSPASTPAKPAAKKSHAKKHRKHKQHHRKAKHHKG